MLLLNTIYMVHVLYLLRLPYLFETLDHLCLPCMNETGHMSCLCASLYAKRAYARGGLLGETCVGWKR